MPPTPTFAAEIDSRRGSLIGRMRVDAGNYESSTARVLEWAQRKERRVVCIANVHMVMETRDSDAFRDMVNRADMVTSDGMPLVWLLRWRGQPKAQRVYGPDLMLHICAAAARKGEPIGLIGGTPEVLECLCRNLQAMHPELRIVAKIAPPFGALSEEQNAGFARAIEESGATIVFVGLGCPKQEKWMAEMSSRIPAVLLGVGAAFNFHAGHVRQSPAWMQRAGLEWLFRLAMEPRRLWRRYLWHNPRFIWAIALEELRGSARSKRVRAGATSATTSLS